MATRWFRGVHPRAPEMPPAMRLTMLACVVAFGLLFTLLVVQRRRQIAQELEVLRLQQESDALEEDGRRCAA